MGIRSTGLIAVLIGGFALSTPAATQVARSPVPSEWELMAAQYLPGTWNLRDETSAAPAVISGTSTYGRDGSLSQLLTITVNGAEVGTADATATWSVRGKVLSVAYSDSSFAELVGTETTFTILELTPTRFRYRDEESGKEITETRPGS